ncbi:MAG: hypothetical protein ACXIU8_02010 [Alkalilacustris sp.]
MAEITTNAALRAEITKADVLHTMMHEAGMLAGGKAQDSRASARIAAPPPSVLNLPCSPRHASTMSPTTWRI